VLARRLDRDLSVRSKRSAIAAIDRPMIAAMGSWPATAVPPFSLKRISLDTQYIHAQAPSVMTKIPKGEES
jgi:hypothetical protein